MPVLEPEWRLIPNPWGPGDGGQCPIGKYLGRVKVVKQTKYFDLFVARNTKKIVFFLVAIRSGISYH
jgi:hypothetical protein